MPRDFAWTNQQSMINIEWRDLTSAFSADWLELWAGRDFVT